MSAFRARTVTRRINIGETLLPLLLLLALPSHALCIQHWIRHYGGEQSANGKCVCLAPDGGYIVGGRRDFRSWLLRVDSLGDSLWALAGPADAAVTGLAPTDDGNWMITGPYPAPSNWSGIFLTKVSDAGETLWSRFYYDQEMRIGAHAMAGAPDGGYLVVGQAGDASEPTSAHDGYAARFDREGNFLWSRCYPALGLDNFESATRCDGGGFLLAGSTFDDTMGREWAWLVRINDNGDTLWTQTYRPNARSDGGFEDVVQTSDGGYVVAGGFSTDTSQGQYYLGKIDSAGNVDWYRTYGGPAPDCAYSVCATRDRGYALVGQCSSYGAGWFDAWLVKTDSVGNVQWSQTYGGTDWDQANDMRQCPDGGYIMTGQTCSYSSGIRLGRVAAGVPPLDNVYLVRTDSVGSTSLPEGSVRHESRRDKALSLRLLPSVQTDSRLTVSYSIPEAAVVEVALYDVDGRKLAVLSSKYRATGLHQETFTLPERRGVGYVRIVTPDDSAIAKLVMTGP